MTNNVRLLVVDRELRPVHPRRARTVATRREISELLAISRDTTKRLFASARISRSKNSHTSAYSRAGISALLSEWSGREIGYPSSPLLTAPEAAAFLQSIGVEIEAAYLARLVGPALAKVVRTRPQAVRVGHHWRFREEDLVAFAELRRQRGMPYR